MFVNGIRFANYNVITRSVMSPGRDATLASLDNKNNNLTTRYCHKY